MTDTGVGGAELTVNVPAVDHAVSAAVVGEESPCIDRTRQNFVPGRSESTVRAGSFSCGMKSSMFLNLASVAIWTWYPLGCGLGTSDHFNVIGRVSVAPFVGESGDGGGGTGLLNNTLNAMTFEGALWIRFASTA